MRWMHRKKKNIIYKVKIGSHMIAEQGFRGPEDYEEIFRVLEEEEIIDHVLSVKLQEMAQFRNLLVSARGMIWNS